VKAVDRLAEAFKRFAANYPDEAENLAKEVLEAIDLIVIKETIRIPTQMNTIIVKGKGPDGKVYEAEFEATFPKGTIILSVGHR
jgi:hypothetical protein